jgi:hypothetical protein
MSHFYAPIHLEILVEMVTHGPHVQHLQPHPFRVPPRRDDGLATVIPLTSQTGILELHPNDQTVVVRAGTTLVHLQNELAEVGHTIPIHLFPGELLSQDLATLISLNLPHLRMAQHGTWRDWVLGMTVLRANGELVKLGSRAVKNVAGYDGTRLMTGSRGVFGMILDVTLRTVPVRGLATLDVQQGTHAEVRCIYRPQRADAPGEAERLVKQLVTYDRAAGVLYLCRAVKNPTAESHQWIAGQAPVQSPAATRLRHAMKQALDPEDKFNRGEFDGGEA